MNYLWIQQSETIFPQRQSPRKHFEVLTFFSRFHSDFWSGCSTPSSSSSYSHDRPSPLALDFTPLLIVDTKRPHFISAELVFLILTHHLIAFGSCTYLSRYRTVDSSWLKLPILQLSNRAVFLRSICTRQYLLCFYEFSGKFSYFFEAAI